jgi:hypothetical protein
VKTPPPRSRWPAVLIVLAVVVVFGRIAGHEFLWWDDQQTIHHNPHLNPPTAAGLVWHWRHPHMGLYVPVTQTAWWLIAQVAYVNEPDPMGIRLNPWLYHAASILVHAASALCVLAILRLLCARDGPALAGAMVFALHPVQIEAVAWASGMKDLLGGLFALAALWQYLRYADATWRNKHYLLATLLFVLAMLAKPAAIVTPLLALAIEVLIVGRSWRLSIGRLWPWLALMIPCAIWTRMIQSVEGPTDLPIWTRPLVALDALAFYIGKLLLPLHLAPDYGRRPQTVLGSGAAYFTWIAPVAIAAALLIWRRRTPWLLAAAAVFGGGVLPIVGLIPFMFQHYSTVADHYLYLSMLGPALALAWIMCRTARPAGWIACAVVLVALGGRSFAQAGHWRDHTAIMTHTLDVNPRSFMACANLGAEHLIYGRLDPAEQMFRKALTIEPEDAKSLDELSLLLLRQGRLAEALDVIERLIPLLPAAGRAQDVPAAQQAVTMLRARVKAGPPPASVPALP